MNPAVVSLKGYAFVNRELLASVSDLKKFKKNHHNINTFIVLIVNYQNCHLFDSFATI